jgi:Domain of unknown function (DUF4936)
VSVPGRSLYIYWKVAPARKAGALQAVRRFQHGLPAVQATVLQRADEANAAAVTLMETYTAPQGLTAEVVRNLIDTSAATLAAWAEGGARHAEVFEPA